MARRYYETVSHALVITEGHIRKVAEAVEAAANMAEWRYDRTPEPISKISWSVEFGDQTGDDNLTTEQVLALQNGASRPITRLKCSTNLGYGRIGISLSESLGGHWTAEADGSEALVSTFHRRVKELLPELKPWWSQLAATSFAWYPPLVVSAFVLCRIIYITLTGEVGESAEDSPEVNEAIASAAVRAWFAFCAVWIFVGAWLDRYRKLIFPKFLVLVGDGIKRAGHAKTRRLALAGSAPFLVSAFLAWVASENPLLVDYTPSVSLEDLAVDASSLDDK